MRLDLTPKQVNDLLNALALALGTVKDGDPTQQDFLAVVRAVWKARGDRLVSAKRCSQGCGAINKIPGVRPGHRHRLGCKGRMVRVGFIKVLR